MSSSNHKGRSEHKFGKGQVTLVVTAEQAYQLTLV
jgi:hypothetical protein